MWETNATAMSDIFQIEDVMEVRCYTGTTMSLQVNNDLKNGWYLVSATHNPYGEPVWMLGLIGDTTTGPSDHATTGPSDP